jgi:MYXO-CTERM domain-containing protein
MTMEEAADLMIGLGAVEAINLDGGGSTAFVVDGSVINRPSDRAVRRDGRTLMVKTPRAGDRVIGNIERPVAVALALVGPRGTALGGDAARASLVVPLGNPGAPVGTSSALLLSGADGPDSSVLLMVLVALGIATFTARRRRVVPVLLPSS